MPNNNLYKLKGSLTLNGSECPFCRGSSFSRYRAVAYDAAPEEVNIIECQACQAGWQWPLHRTEAQSKTFFKQAYKQQEIGTYFDTDLRNTVANCQREFIESHIKTPGNLLDVGCGDGVFAKNMARHGWNVVGLDPAIKVQIYENYSTGRLNLSSKFVADLPVGERFDLITLWDVIEHVEKPDQLISDAVSRLAPGGMLVVETGNYQCADRILSNKNWWNFQMDHRWYFGPPQLQEIFTSNGLENVELASRVLRPWWKGKAEIKRLGLISTLKSMLTSPVRAIDIWNCYQKLATVEVKWSDWGGLEIMTMTGRKPSVDPRKTSDERPD